ncbi:MAG TPA: methylthioribulose 1-phosphate dehydratase [Rhodanobacteraceae bacterium]|nr:methylthioribulose 1-phosphate dehydratase [Rhodanobacteraceae bacterium]
MHADSNDASFATRAEAICRLGAELAARGWTPATSSNFSLRIDQHSAAITRSGRDKGRLVPDDIMRVTLDGRALPGDTAVPSAEAPLHGQIYRRMPQVEAVLHTHSRVQTVASRLFAAAGELHLQGWELQKAIAGTNSHERTLALPVFANSQSMAELTRAVDDWVDAGKPLHAYLIAGHGIYTWGSSIDEARRHLEALEFLLACELDLRRLGVP